MRRSATALEQLRQSEENYRGLFENATGAIEVHDLNGRIINANRAFEKLTGYSLEELQDAGRHASSWRRRTSRRWRRC